MAFVVMGVIASPAGSLVFWLHLSIFHPKDCQAWGELPMRATLGEEGGRAGPNSTDVALLIVSPKGLRQREKERI